MSLNKVQAVQSRFWETRADRFWYLYPQPPVTAGCRPMKKLLVRVGRAVGHECSMVIPKPVPEQAVLASDAIVLHV